MVFVSSFRFAAVGKGLGAAARNGFPSEMERTKEGRIAPKKPTGLSVDFAYLKPGNPKTDKRGEDFLIEEKELMRFLDKADLGRTSELTVILLDIRNACKYVAALQAKKTGRWGGSTNATTRPETKVVCYLFVQTINSI